MLSRKQQILSALAVCAIPVGMALVAASPAMANTSFTVKAMTRGDVPSGQGQCDIRVRVDNEIELALRGNQVQTRTLSGSDTRDEGSECSAPLPVGTINNFRWEKRDGRGNIDLLEEPSSRNSMRAIFRVRDSEGGAGRYHIRIKWDLSGSTDSGGGRGGNSSWGNSGRDRDRGRGRDQNQGWGNSGNNNSGWGNDSGWGNVTPPTSLSSSGRGDVQWSGRQNLNATQSSVNVNGNRATIRVNTSENRTVEFSGNVRSSSNGILEVDLDQSSEGAFNGVARIDYSNRNRLDRVDINGTAGRNRVRVDFRR